MPEVVHVAIHPSQFPEQIRRDLLQSLRSRKVNHKFHYDSVRQTRKWLALHEAYSPARKDPDCLAIYDEGFSEAVKAIEAASVHVIGLGCGGGQKDARLLELLKQSGKNVAYTPCDIGSAMVLVACAAARSFVLHESIHPLVCDLATTENLPAVIDKQSDSASARLITFFGMIPNFEPTEILPRLAGLVRPADHLLFSANMAPGSDYAAGVRRILPLYDNDLTRDWLMTFLLDLGVERDNGNLRLVVEDDSTGLKRIAAHFHLTRARRITVDGETIDFRAGESIRLFFSYRHTPAFVRAMLEPHGLKVIGQWITKSEEEGVFFVRRS